MLNDDLKWRHAFAMMAIILAIAIGFSLETGRPVDTENMTIDATSVLVLGG